MKANRTSPEGFINDTEAAKMLCVSVRTIRTLCKNRTVPHYKLGHFIYFKREELLAAIECGRVGVVS